MVQCNPTHQALSHPGTEITLAGVPRQFANPRRVGSPGLVVARWGFNGRADASTSIGIMAVHDHVARFSVQQVTCRWGIGCERKRAEQDAFKGSWRCVPTPEHLLHINNHLPVVVYRPQIGCPILPREVPPAESRSEDWRGCERLAWYPCCPASDMLLACCWC